MNLFGTRKSERLERIYKRGTRFGRDKINNQRAESESSHSLFYAILVAHHPSSFITMDEKTGENLLLCLHDNANAFLVISA